MFECTFIESMVIVVLILGIPPCNAKDYDTNKQAEIEKDCSSIDWRCIGPIGLDFKLKDVSKEDQIYAFEEQVDTKIINYMYIHIHKKNNNFTCHDYYNIYIYILL